MTTSPTHHPPLAASDVDRLAADLAADVDSWQSWTAADGSDVEVRLRVLPDDVGAVEQVNDADSWGRLEWGRFDRYAVSCDAYGYPLRPRDFDGNAEVIYHDHRDRLWWQPPADVPRTSEHFASLRASVRDLIEYGFVGYVVDVRSDVDTAYGPRTVDVASASLWGIDTRDPSEYVDAVADLIAECFDVRDDQ